jgi:hypothetical protein
MTESILTNKPAWNRCATRSKDSANCGSTSCIWSSGKIALRKFPGKKASFKTIRTASEHPQLERKSTTSEKTEIIEKIEKIGLPEDIWRLRMVRSFPEKIGDIDGRDRKMIRKT